MTRASIIALALAIFSVSVGVIVGFREYDKLWELQNKVNQEQLKVVQKFEARIQALEEKR